MQALLSLYPGYIFLGDAEVVKMSDCDLSTAGLAALSHSEWTGISSLTQL